MTTVKQTPHFKTVEYRTTPAAGEYEAQYQQGWLLYAQPVANKGFDPLRGDFTMWTVTYVSQDAYRL